MTQSKVEQLLALRKKVNASYKGEVAASGQDRRNRTPALRISTGSLSLDFACGVESGGIGGVPIGQITMAMGEKSSGKTTFALKVLANMQRVCARCYRPVSDIKVVPAVDSNGEPMLTEDGDPVYTLSGTCDCYQKKIWRPHRPKVFSSAKAENEYLAYVAELDKNPNSYEPTNCVYVDVENALDLEWAQQNGVILAVLQHTVPGSAEETVDIVAEYVSSGAVDLLVLDSIAQMCPEKEQTASAEEWQQGLAARLTNKGVRSWVAGAAKVRTLQGRFVTQIWIQQYREKLGPFPSKVTPGGKQQRFATAVEVEFFQSDQEEEVDPATAKMPEKDQIKRVVACRVNYKILKNKTAPTEKMCGSFKMSRVADGELRPGQVIELEYLLKMAMQYGIVQRQGSKYIFRGKDFSSQSAIQAVMASQAHVLDWLKRQLLHRMAGYPVVEK